MHTIYIETFGCQMNINDTAIVRSIMAASGFALSDDISQSDVILLNTCSVRENAEEKVFNRLTTLYHLVKNRKQKTVVGVLGCMAEHLQDNLFNINNVVSLVVGPDGYKQLPELVAQCFLGASHLSRTSTCLAPNLAKSEPTESSLPMNSLEDYADVIPQRQSGIASYISIMRGCNNFCSYCVVPYTRGRERSRSNVSILKEIETLAKQSIKEVTLLGQNVNSYSYSSTEADTVNFPLLLSQIATTFPLLRIRFLTSHPRNMSMELIETIATYDNICNYIHLPVQSGSNRVLSLMNRKYTAEHYLDLIHQIKQTIVDVAISTDIIAGYPSETLSDHKATLDLFQTVRYSNAFMFRYSPRQGTKAYTETDDVPEDEKIRRLNEIISLQNKISTEENKKEIGRIVEGLVENASKRNPNDWFAKTKTAKLVVFDNSCGQYKAGDLVQLKITKATSATLTGVAKEKRL